MTKAALFVNLGSPKSAEKEDVKSYLREFLMDEYVIDSPFLIRWFIVNALILPKRPIESAHAYQTIWTDEGSPLIVISKLFLEKIKTKINTPSYLAMRYNEPSIKNTLKEITDNHADLDTILLCPMYPHYAMSSVTTVVEKTIKELKKLNDSITVEVLPPFYNEPAYIESLRDSLLPYIKEESYVLFSYHGLPERHLRKTDPSKTHCLNTISCCETDSLAHKTCYYHQIKVTTALVADRCNLNKESYSFACQSRLGKDPWIKPYTDLEIHSLLEKGVKHLVVISPSFVVDCLETIEELGDRLRQDWIENGGETFSLVPCLNTNDDWIDRFAQLTNAAIKKIASKQGQLN
jgi:protoporphyrin/coproporphyrin ferrochelatase